MKENDFLSYASPDVIIDLHNYKNVEEAIMFMDTEIYEPYKNKKEFIRVIHGIGSGVMKNKVHESLKKNPLISEFSVDESGGSTMLKL
ncbi:MAG: Smr/MutS family protein [Patescibacteria group bacterium]|nr:Smr/MutS family protein [Patescibacteria group bacterium]